MALAMTKPRCPYLVCETTAIRETLDVREAAPLSVTVTWYCRHPFHGIRLELGDGRSDMEKHCAVCSLPRELPDGDSG